MAERMVPAGKKGEAEVDACALMPENELLVSDEGVMMLGGTGEGERERESVR